MNAPWSKRISVALILLIVGFGLRLWVATVTDNADARTLTWGSAFLATGHLDPYKEVVANSLDDPIPLGSIRSLSLAQGYLGVTAGAVPLALSDMVGAIHLGDSPDGHAFGKGEIFAYKLSYLLPEVLVIALTLRLLGPRRRELGLALWAFNPFIIFTWGQGMPDTWTVAIMLAAAWWFRRLRESPEEAPRRYLECAAIIAFGSMGTKLFPLVCAVPWIAQLARDSRLPRMRRWQIGAGGALIAVVAVLPYLINPFIRANVLVRFEFDMLFTGAGVQSASALASAQFGLVALILATWWLLRDADILARVEPWLAAVAVVVTTTAGLITHLLTWMFVGIVLLAVRVPVRAVVLQVAGALAVAWHLLSYAWLAGLVANAIDSQARVGSPYEWVQRNVPAATLLGSTVSSFLFVAAIGALCGFIWPNRPHLGSLGARGSRLILGAAMGVTLVAMIGSAVAGISVGSPVWDFGYATYPTDRLMELKRGDRWTSELVTADATVNQVSFRVSEQSQPSLDVIRVSLLRNGEELGVGQMPMWQAEPLSDRGHVKIELDHEVNAYGSVFVIERVGEEAGDSAQALLRLSAKVTPESALRPDVRLEHSNSALLGWPMLSFFLSPVRVLLVPFFAALLGLWVHRRLRLSEDVAEEILPEVTMHSIHGELGMPASRR